MVIGELLILSSLHQSPVDALMQNIDYSNRSHQVDKGNMIKATYTMFWKNKEARKMDGHPNSLSGSLTALLTIT